MPQNRKSDNERILNPNKVQIAKMSPRYRAIMYRLVMGDEPGVIARDMGMNPSRLSAIINSKLFILERQKVEEDVLQRLESSASLENRPIMTRELLARSSAMAATELVKMATGAESEVVRQRSCLEILDRTGFTTTEKVEQLMTVVVAKDNESNALAALASVEPTVQRTD